VHSPSFRDGPPFLRSVCIARNLLYLSTRVREPWHVSTKGRELFWIRPTPQSTERFTTLFIRLREHLYRKIFVDNTFRLVFLLTPTRRLSRYRLVQRCRVQANIRSVCIQPFLWPIVVPSLQYRGNLYTARFHSEDFTARPLRDVPQRFIPQKGFYVRPL
jgi:hypothetical protein